MNRATPPLASSSSEDSSAMNDRLRRNNPITYQELTMNCSPDESARMIVTASDASTMGKLGWQSPDQDDDNELFSSNGSPQKSFPEVVSLILGGYTMMYNV
jgi:hypothetical protein